MVGGSPSKFSGQAASEACVLAGRMVVSKTRVFVHDLLRHFTCAACRHLELAVDDSDASIENLVFDNRY